MKAYPLYPQRAVIDLAGIWDFAFFKDAVPYSLEFDPAEFINENTVIIRPDDLSEEDRNSKMMNTAMLAKLNQHLKFPQDLWLDLIRENFKGQIAEDNIEVFRKAAQ